MSKIYDLILANCLSGGDRLIWKRNSDRTVHVAIISSNGTVTTEDGRVHKSPSGAAKHLAGRPIDGWLAWKLESSGESLDVIRKRFLNNQ
jgi:hypothetical protein